MGLGKAFVGDRNSSQYCKWGQKTTSTFYQQFYLVRICTNFTISFPCIFLLINIEYQNLFGGLNTITLPGKGIQMHQMVFNLFFVFCEQEQYVFIHLAVLEVLTCGNTEIPAHNLQNVMNKLSTINPQKQISGFATEFEV